MKVSASKERNNKNKISGEKMEEIYSRIGYEENHEQSEGEDG